MEEVEEAAATEGAALPMEGGCVDVAEDDPPFGDNPGDADGVGNPLSGVEPRLNDVRGNFGNGSKSCPQEEEEAPQVESED